MAFPAESESLDLTGHWIGRFGYPMGRCREPVDFTATFEDRDGWLTGSTHEVGEVAEATGKPLTATSPAAGRAARRVS